MPTSKADRDAGPASPGPISAAMMKEASTTVRLIIEPTEMSKPRTISTLNCAMVTSASGAVASRMWRILIGGQEDVGLGRGVAADEGGQHEQEGERHPPFAAAARKRFAELVQQSAAGSRRAVAARMPRLPRGVRNDETMFSSLTRRRSSSRTMRPRENTSTRSQMPASSSASEELTMQADALGRPCARMAR